MRLFHCRGCEARSEEIDHLRAELDRVHTQKEQLERRLTEIVEPGIERRMASTAARAERPMRPGEAVTAAPTRRRFVNFPGYERPREPERYDVTDSPDTSGEVGGGQS